MLGGSHFVGHALVEVAVEAGHDVCALNRGLTGHRVPGARLLCADRTNESELTAAIGDEQFDSVIDTWSGAPTYVKSAAHLLGPRAAHYGYVSSRSVYAWPNEIGLDESGFHQRARSPASTIAT